MKYTKPPLSYEKQAQLVLERGLVANKDDLINALKRIGYFRLSGYWHHYLRNDVFVENTTLEKILNLYEFDEDLRRIVFSGISTIEIYIRTQLAYLNSIKYGAFGFLNRSSLPQLKDSEYEDFLNTIKHELKRSKEPYALHFKIKYGDYHEEPPYWQLVNLLSFGGIYILYKGSDKEIQKEIASGLDMSPKLLDSWLNYLRGIRNICAHHARLWNKEFTSKPKLPLKANKPLFREMCRLGNNRVWIAILIIQYLTEQIDDKTKWRRNVDELLAKSDKEYKLNMGFYGQQ